MFKLSVCEKVENEQEKAPMHLAPGLFDNFVNLKYRTIKQER